MPRKLLFLTLTVFIFSTSWCQTQLSFGPEFEDDKNGFSQHIVGSNNHFFFTSSTFGRSFTLRIYNQKTNALVDEFSMKGSEEHVNVAVSLNKDFYFLIQENENESTIEKRNSANETVAESTFSSKLGDDIVSFHSVIELEGKEALLFQRLSNSSKSYVYFGVSENTISNEFKPYIDFQSKEYTLSTFNGVPFKYAREKRGKKTLIRAAEISEDFELKEERKVEIGSDYYLSTSKNLFGEGLVIFGHKLNSKTKVAEYVLAIDGEITEFQVNFDEKMRLSSENIFQFEKHFLVVGDYSKKGENGIYTLKLDYQGKILNKEILKMYGKHTTRFPRKPSSIDFQISEIMFDDSTKTVVAVGGLLETFTNSKGSSIEYFSELNPIGIDESGKIKWKHTIEVIHTFGFRMPWLRRSALHDHHLYIVHSDGDGRNAYLEKISMEGKIVEKKEYRGKEGFTFVDVSTITQNGLFVMKCDFSDAPGFQRNVRYANVKLW